MKKHSRRQQSAEWNEKPSITVGLDLGDRFSHYCQLNQDGEITGQSRIPTTEKGLRKQFAGKPQQRIAMECGTHSPWVSRLLKELGHQVIVANARKLRAISENESKSDEVDAEMLADLAYYRPRLLHPLHHRSAERQQDLNLLRSRDMLVRSRTMLVNGARGLVKSSGGRLPACSSESFSEKAKPALPAEMKKAITPLLQQIASLSEAIAKSRSVGAYLGLRPGRDQSGSSDPERGISKTGNGYMRRLLVQSAHYTLSRHGEDSALRAWGLRLASSGGKRGKKRAVIAVARKLSVILHAMWRSGEKYQAFPVKSEATVETTRPAVEMAA